MPSLHVLRLADAGRESEARTVAASLERAAVQLEATDAAVKAEPAFVRCAGLLAQGALSFGQQDFRRAQAQLLAARDLVQAIDSAAPHEGFIKFQCTLLRAAGGSGSPAHAR